MGHSNLGTQNLPEFDMFNPLHARSTACAGYMVLVSEKFFIVDIYFNYSVWIT
jgi:hypothetical protein